MFDIGWSELLIIGVVALIVIGPKDLPEMFRTLGRFTAKLRSMSRDFQRAMEAAAKDSGVSDIARDVKNVASPKNLGLDAVRSAADRFEKWDPLKPTPAPKPAPAVAPAAAPVAAAPVAAAPMGPATAALAEAKAKERAAARASVENRIAAPALANPPAAGVAPPAAAVAAKVKKSAAAKSPEAAPAKPAKARAAKPDAAKADPETKPRKARKATPEGKDA
jgi:sec-independent protein translocase protein TatB